MDIKEVVTIVVAIAMAAIIGFLLIAMVQNFLNDGGLIFDFFKEAFNIVFERAKLLINPTTTP